MPALGTVVHCTFCAVVPGTVVQWYSVPVPGQEAADVKSTWFTLSVPGLGVKQKQIVSTFLCSPLILVKVKSCQL